MTTKEGTKQKEPSPPSPAAILVGYTILGSLVSFLAGRDPGTLPDNVVREVAPALVVVAGFLVSYSVYDVMAVGVAKQQCPAAWKSYKDMSTATAVPPEPVFLAQRVQTNQVEQMPVFLVGTLGCALVVNGTVAAVLALLWTILRRMYASTYRNAVGIPFAEMGLAQFTIPAYFLSNTMVMSVAVHAVRAMFASSADL
mmetsp:Transcript_11444/g.21829  ORF Transcript_11444/g.21829 Transcript_11444/m.21829 type:complete len:198 (-) Transcript_11444:318-911(-)|eukprot:scaffold492_cov99-Amphora_coffeaeformis.AAC.4